MRRFLILLPTFFILFVVLSTHRTVIGDVSYAGTESCKSCHEDFYNSFIKTTHGIKANPRTPAAKQGCESCHGPGGGHVTTGDKAAILNPAKLKGEAVAEKCLECHSKDKGQMFWKGSVHSSNELGCTSCHGIHSSKEKLLKKAVEKDVCFTCHYDVRSSMFKRSKHPLRDSSSPSGEGKMTCSSCHSPHGARAEKLINAKSVNDKCYECHAEKKAPLLWEHAPVKEDCLTCHTAHGSSNDKMLVTKVPRLCQQCHMQGRHQSGALGINSVYLFNRACLNCHPMIHGSNSPSGAVLQR